MLVLITNLNV